MARTGPITTIAVLNAAGRLTLPVSIRRELGLGENDQLAVTVDDGRIILTPLATVPRAHLWFYRSEAQARLRPHEVMTEAGLAYRGLSQEELIAILPPDQQEELRAELEQADDDTSKG